MSYVIPKTRKLKMNMFGQNGTHVKRTYERTCAQVNTQVNERVNVHVILRWTWGGTSERTCEHNTNMWSSPTSVRAASFFSMTSNCQCLTSGRGQPMARSIQCHWLQSWLLYLAHAESVPCCLDLYPALHLKKHIFNIINLFLLTLGCEADAAQNCHHHCHHHVARKPCGLRIWRAERTIKSMSRNVRKLKHIL